EEERFIRVKHADGYFPINAINFCLETGNITMQDVDNISIGWDVNEYVENIPQFYEELRETYKDIIDEDSLDWQNRTLKRFQPATYKQQIVDQFNKHGFTNIPEIKFVDHHYSHALAAYYCSGYKDAIVITVDGHGQKNCTILWKVENGQFEVIKEFNIPHSLGWFYAAFTKFLGFRVYDGEGKVMGLAPYGKTNEKFKKYVTEMVKLVDDGYVIDPSYISFGKKTVEKNFTDKFTQTFGERPQNGVFNQDHKDIAFEAQDRLEVVAAHLVNSLVEKTNIKNLCIAGGVALNCKMNGYVWRECGIENIFIQPISGDDGTAFGSAMAVYLENGGDPANFEIQEHVYYGPDYSDEEIEAALKKANLTYQKSINISKETAEFIADGKVVAWFQGKMEAGPRALGNRSILTDPRNAKMKDIVNNKVKFREPWRPFCPSMLYECAPDYLEKWYETPFMILTFQIKQDKVDKIPAVVHVDNTARPQLVKREINPMYYDLIKEFENITGEGVVLNTSFNIRGEPIVCTPEDAIDCFLKTGIEVLVMSNFLVKK
ncbi:MAG: carbamoyltransferase C-terminal domain-containing protein, partial [Anaerolineales bacterium]